MLDPDVLDLLVLGVLMAAVEHCSGRQIRHPGFDGQGSGMRGKSSCLQLAFGG